MRVAVEERIGFGYSAVSYEAGVGSPLGNGVCVGGGVVGVARAVGYAFLLTIRWLVEG